MKITAFPGAADQDMGRPAGKDFEIDLGMGVCANHMNGSALRKFFKRLSAANQRFRTKKPCGVDLHIRMIESIRGHSPVLCR